MMIISRACIASLILCCALGACSGGGSSSNQTPGPSGRGTVNGMVTDIGTGGRVPGANVSGGGQSAVADSRGEFTLSGLATGTVSISVTATGFAPGFATARAGDQAAPVIVSLKQQGTLQTYDASAAATLSERTEAGPYALILQPGSLDTSASQLRVSITPLDPTKEKKALPGNLLTGGSSPSVLFPVTFAEFTILDPAGKRVQLKASASALVELPIPPSLRATYPLGSKIHCYAYDSTTAAWEDFVEGTVQVSSVDHTSPVLSASVRHFSWYGGAPQGQNCADVYVNVVSAVDGKPLGNARVEATPGTTAYTDANGSAQVIAALGSPGSSYTAYQTGFDVDGSLTGIKGAKYIEFGVVEEDLVGLVKRSCTGTATPLAPTTRTAAVIGTQGSPLVIKVGVLKDVIYEATATLSAGRGGSNGSVAVILNAGPPGPDGKLVNPQPATGAKMILADGSGQSVPLVEIAAGSGFYASSAGLSITPGNSYTLSIDADGNGSVDGAGTIAAVGDLAWINPTNGADVAAAGLEASWSDTGTATANPAYAPVYIALVQGSSDTAYYLGTDPHFPVVKAPSNDPLSPGTYTATLLAFSGFYAQAGGGVQVARNISGAGVTGTFLSLGGAPDPITFTVH
jgi:hypothetical protein